MKILKIFKYPQNMIGTMIGVLFKVLGQDKLIQYAVHTAEKLKVIYIVYIYVL